MDAVSIDVPEERYILMAVTNVFEVEIFGWQDVLETKSNLKITLKKQT